jgi:nucleoside-diphosphate-sugar epimerase
MRPAIQSAAMEIFVTGGSGYIGSRLIPLLFANKNKDSSS